MDVNLWYVEDINTLSAMYSSFVHHIATEQSKKKLIALDNMMVKAYWIFSLIVKL
jgi:hypothetical protein